MCKIIHAFSSLFMMLSCLSSSDLMASKEDENQQQVRLVKVQTQDPDLTLLEETGRGNHYLNEVELSEPFGLYKLIIGADVVGFQSVSPYLKSGVIIAEEMTDVLEVYQSKGYGKILRRKMAELFDGYIGKPMSMNHSEDSLGNESTIFAYLYSDNEWYWGGNGASLKSSLDAGYGIISISGRKMGLVQMLYPRNKTHWSDEKVNLLLQASRINCQGAKKESIPFLLKIIEKIDFKQETDLSTFCCIIGFVDNFKTVEASKMLEEHIQGIAHEDMEYIASRVSDGANNLEKQIIDPTFMLAVNVHGILEIIGKYRK
ncbi:MAG: hypothetical protein KBB83_07000 [Alphaproteobacteria bacterium]|nr:hypothetical protein [Alphaproteobacteria bacterium]